MTPSFDSQRLRVLIEDLRSEWPDLLGAGAAAFIAELDALLPQATDGQVLEFFARNPQANRCLLDELALLDQEDDDVPITRGLFGHPLLRRPHFSYLCESGAHSVIPYEVFRYTPDGRPLCPLHASVLIRQ